MSRPGDTLLLFFTANQNPATTTAPAGLDRSSQRRSQRSSRSALDADGDRRGRRRHVAVANSEITKADLKVVAYRGTGAEPLDVHAVSCRPRPATQHTAPSVTPTQDGDWVVVYWADKSSTNTDHTVPASLTKLAPTTTGTGGGYITATIAGMAARLRRARPRAPS